MAAGHVSENALCYENHQIVLVGDRSRTQIFQGRTILFKIIVLTMNWRNLINVHIMSKNMAAIFVTQKRVLHN